jgi:hypothetical protein
MCKWVRDDSLKALIENKEVSKIEKEYAVALVKQWNEE